MKVGIIAEGRGDLAVITNILKGVLNIDQSDIQYILPEYDLDETDLAKMPPEQFSSWSVVRQKCIERTNITRFFNNPIDDNRFLIIHLDTAERFQKNYDVTEPAISQKEGYVEEVRSNVIRKMNEWMGDQSSNQIDFAVAVEETDAWVLTIFENSTKETAYLPNAKERLKRIINKPNFMRNKDRKSFFQMSVFEQYRKLSADFRKTEKLTQNYCLRNKSLSLFCDDLRNR
jgi:hypothetical protein